MKLLKYGCESGIEGIDRRIAKLINEQISPYPKRFFRDDRGNNPLHIVLQTSGLTWNQKLSLVKLLASGDWPDDINLPNSNGETPLIIAAKSDYATLEYLLTFPSINVNYQDNSGNTALHYAVSIGANRRTNALIARGIDANLQNNQGQTPMHLTSNQHFIQLLKDVGADETITEVSGLTPREFRINQDLFYIVREKIGYITGLFD